MAIADFHSVMPFNTMLTRSVLSRVQATDTAEKYMLQKTLINGLVFETRTGPKGTVTGIQIGRHWVFQGLLEWTLREARESIPTLAFLKPLKVQEILDDPLWRTRKFGTRIAIGRCLKLFVRRNLIPLRESNPDKKGPRKYVPDIGFSININRTDVE